MTAEDRVKQFWPFWSIRVVWLLSLLALGWWLNGNSLPSLLLLAIGGALLLQGLFFVLATLRRLPRSHDLFSAAMAALLTSLALILFAEQWLLFLLLGIVPFLDVSRWHGWGAVLLLPLFPIFALAYNFVQPERVLPEVSVWGVWGLTVLLGCGLARASLRAPLTRKSPEIEAEVEGQENVLARLSQVLARESRYDRIMEALVRSGSEAIDSGGNPRIKSRAMGLTFKPGLHDVLMISALHNMEQLSTERSFELKGVLGTLMQDGDPIDTDSSQPPFNDLRVLEGHRILLFPLCTGLDVYGAVMFATKDHKRAATEEVQATLIAMVDQVSLALHNAVLQQELQRDRNQRLGGEEEARHQLARDLHDGPVQRVAAISMQLEFIKALVKRDPTRALGEIEQLQQVAKNASQEMRTMLFTLRPVVLESEGLTAALQTFVDRLRDQDKLKITFKADPLPRLDGKVEDVAFAIMQEAIGNAKKYSGGAAIHVRLIKGQTMVVGQVEDEGPGFDLKAVTTNYGSRASLGLLNMQERAAMVGGQLRIDTAPGKGTVVSITVPFARD